MFVGRIPIIPESVSDTGSLPFLTLTLLLAVHLSGQIRLFFVDEHLSILRKKLVEILSRFILRVDHEHALVLVVPGEVILQTQHPVLVIPRKKTVVQRRINHVK